MAKKNKLLDNLTACSIAAEKAGMSYGKYMALKYERNGFRPEPKPESEPEYLEEIPAFRECPYCHKMFSTNSRPLNSRYCSNECFEANRREAAARAAKERKKNAPKRFCVWCGKEIPVEKNWKSKTCSEACKVQYRSAYQRDRRAERKEQGQNGKA